MKVLFVKFNIMNPGGIRPHTEQLAAGMKELGHTVHIVNLHPGSVLNTDDSREIPIPKDEVIKDWEKGVFGLWHHNWNGWLFPGNNLYTIPYASEECMNHWHKFASEYDLVIWTTLCPTKKKENEGNFWWPRLYDIPKPTKQVGIVHDGNMPRYVPWAVIAAEKMDGVAAVHGAAFAATHRMDTYHTMIVNPQNLSTVYTEDDWSSRENAFYSGSSYKSWKHNDCLMRAIPHLHGEVTPYMAGGGLEESYMTSPNKTKEHYWCSELHDPDLAEVITQEAIDKYGDHEYGNGRVRIFDLALFSGMKWLGHITESHRDQLLRKCKLLIDPSWSKNYAQQGDHFNRVVVEAMMQGTIPLACNLGISTNIEGISDIFTPGENYIMIPYDCTPKQYAQIIRDACNMPIEEANRIRNNNFELIKKFDRKLVAKMFIDLSNQQIDPKDSPLRVEEFVSIAGKGNYDKELHERADDYLTNFFGVTANV